MEIPPPQEILDQVTSAVDNARGTSNSTSSLIVKKVPASLIDTTFSSYTNLTSSSLAASVISCSDEWFAEAKNLLTAGPPVRKPGVFVFSGAWYDGWETRRHNPAPFDWVVISLGCVGRIEGVEVDTAHFNGNEAPEVALEGCYLSSESEQLKTVGAETFQQWDEILPLQPCGPSQRQAWTLAGPEIDNKQFTHLRLKMYPDGGIARLRVYGHVVPPPLPPSVLSSSEPRPLEDLAATLNGGIPISCSDQHFGRKDFLTLPGRGKDMGDGWETARSRHPDHVDWVIIRLGLKGRSIEKIIVDTKDFRGNFPRAVKVDAWPQEPAKAALGQEPEPSAQSKGWVTLVGETNCQADFEHVFTEGSGLASSVPLQDWVWTHVKMTIIPDGGVKRLRVFGRRA